MADDRKQSPHYIPELDPEYTGKDFGGKTQKLFWIIIFLGAVIALASIPFFLSGEQTTAIVLLAIGLSMMLFLFGI